MICIRGRGISINFHSTSRTNVRNLLELESGTPIAAHWDPTRDVHEIA